MAVPDSKVYEANMDGPTGPMWAPYWPRELCYLRPFCISHRNKIIFVPQKLIFKNQRQNGGHFLWLQIIKKNLYA